MDSRSNEGRIRDNRGTKKRPLDVWEESAMDRDQQSLVGPDDLAVSWLAISVRQ